MKKCPRCLKYDDDNVRFCKHCGTELFFEERFESENNGEKSKRKDGIIKRIFSKTKEPL